MCFSRMTQLPFRQGAINFPVYDSARKGISPIPKMPNNFLFFFSSVQILYLTPKRNKWFFTLHQKPKVLEGWQPPGGRALWLITVNTSSICKQPRPSSLVTNDWLCDQRQQAPTGQTEWTHSSLVKGSMSQLRLLSSTAFCTTERQDYTCRCQMSGRFQWHPCLQCIMHAFNNLKVLSIILLHNHWYLVCKNLSV